MSQPYNPRAINIRRENEDIQLLIQFGGPNWNKLSDQNSLVS